MKINLKLGSITAKEFAELSSAKLYTASEGALAYTIGNLTDEIGEIAQNTLYIVSADNSLAEMMAAAKNGAFAVLCTKAPDSLEKIPQTAVLVCEDVWTAMETFAKNYIRRIGVKTIALTGSMGKTRTGEFVYSVLEEMYKVHKATDKKVSARDDALALLELTEDTDFFLVEMKLRDRRDIKRLAHLIDCDVGIITRIESNIDEMANLDVLAGLRDGGELAVSAEDERIDLVCRSGLTPKTVSVQNADATLYAENIKEYRGRTVFDICGKDVQIRDVEIHFAGAENVYSALFAALVGIKYGVPEEKIRTGLKNYHSSELGVEIYTESGITFIEDFSSATEESVKSGIDTLCEIAKLHKGSRKIALVGDIRDFGQDTGGLHERMGAYIAEKKLDKLFTFGVAAELIGTGAARAGMSKTDIFGNMELFAPLKSAEALANALRPGDILLIRMGRQNAAQEITRYLKEQLENA